SAPRRRLPRLRDQLRPAAPLEEERARRFALEGRLEGDLAARPDIGARERVDRVGEEVDQPAAAHRLRALRRHPQTARAAGADRAARHLATGGLDAEGDAARLVPRGRIEADERAAERQRSGAAHVCQHLERTVATRDEDAFASAGEDRALGRAAYARLAEA